MIKMQIKLRIKIATRRALRTIENGIF